MHHNGIGVGGGRAHYGASLAVVTAAYALAKRLYSLCSWQSKAGRRVLAIATVIHVSSLESFCPISKNDAYHNHAFLLLSGENASPGVMPSA